MRVLERFHALLDGNVENNKFSKAYNAFSSALIIISVILIILESYQSVQDIYGDHF